MDTHRQPGEAGTTVLRPPGQPSDGDRGASGVRWLWLALGVLLLVTALAVMFALPAMVSPVQPPAAAEKAPPPEQPQAGSGAQRDLAQQAMQDYLQLRARLGLENAPAWGEPDWSEAGALATAGDRRFAQRQFEAAAGSYQSALALLHRMEANRGVMLAASLEAAQRALAANDIEAANAGFEAVLLIEPEHPAANEGLVRARSRLASIAQMELGRKAESDGDLDVALAAYRQAEKLDASHVQAGEAVGRLSAQVDELLFAAAMTRALEALDAGQMAAAAKALDQAGRLRLDDGAVRDARRRMQEMQAQAALSRLRRQVDDKVRGEDWQAATGLYRKALAIDPDAGFARSGLQHAQERAKLHAQFDHYLDKPARVYAAEPRANAEKLLAVASEAPPGEQRLARKITTLRELLARANTPVTVTLKSDGATDVVVYRVGRLGRFDSYQLELLPGDYTIVGSRPGYRDVRKVISLRPGVRVPPLQLRCEEVI